MKWKLIGGLTHMWKEWRGNSELLGPNAQTCFGSNLEDFATKREKDKERERERGESFLLSEHLVSGGYGGPSITERERRQCLQLRVYICHVSDQPASIVLEYQTGCRTHWCVTLIICRRVLFFSFSSYLGEILI